MSRAIQIPDPLPCPCCGNTDLYVGVMSSASMGVFCKPNDETKSGCGLKIERGFPETNRFRSMSLLEKHVLRRAILAWNRRVGSNKKTGEG